VKRLTQRGRDLKVAILKGEDFTAGAMSGKQTEDTCYHETGRLDGQAWNLLRDDNPGYVVYSYSTPIAWFVSSRPFGSQWSDSMATKAYWTVPDRRYSVTTSRHQNIVRSALESMGLTYEQ